MSAPPAGWYDDGEHPGRLRYWDGERWTDHISRPMVGLERAAGPIEFDPDYRPQHAAFPRNGLPRWVWLGPVLVLASGALTLLVLWLTGSLVWAPAPPMAP